MSLSTGLLIIVVLVLVSSSWQNNTYASGFKFVVTRTPRYRPTQVLTGPQQSNVLSSDVSIVNGDEFVYMIRINIGGQELPVILDTGSSDLWVVSTDCTASDCQGVERYSPTASSSLSLSSVPFRLSYLAGSVSGNIGFETITLGPYQIYSQVFALADRTVSLGLTGTGNSGILGLSFPSEAAISLTSGNTVLQNIFSAFSEPDRFFAFKLGRNPNGHSYENLKDCTSSFTIGELDLAIANDTSGFVYTNVSRAGSNSYTYWKLPLQKITINSTALPLTASLVPGAGTPIAVLDSGTTLILGPTSDVKLFWETVGQGIAARKNKDNGRWEVRCQTGVVVGFVLGEEGSEKEYMIHPGDISWKEAGSSDGWCTGGIQANDEVNSGDWLLGDVFLRNVYVTHHGSNSTHPPVIGLLNLTDPASAMLQFRLERGPDPLGLSLPSSAQIRSTIPSVPRPNSKVIYAIATICGFLGGIIVTVLLRNRWQMRGRRIGGGGVKEVM